MSNKCSAPGCNENYDSPENYATVFKLPKSLDLRHRWIQALHLVDTHVNTFVCEKHFHAEDISRTLLVPSGPIGLIH